MGAKAPILLDVRTSISDLEGKSAELKPVVAVFVVVLVAGLEICLLPLFLKLL